MAKAATDEQVQLRKRARRRLIGALALVTLIAVVLPWILESEPKPSDQEISIQIPSPSDYNAFTSRVVPGTAQEPRSAEADADASKPPTAEHGAGGGSGGAPASEPKTVHAAAANGSAGEHRPKPVKESISPAVDAKKASERRPSIAGDEQFVVQVSALNDAAKASAMQKALAAKGLRSYTEVVKTASGDVTRVRVGPFPNRARAAQEQAKLKALGFNGNVVPR